MKTKNSADKCAKAIFVLLAVLLLLAGCIINSSNQTYTVTFDSNGGSAVNSQTIISGNCATEPRDPTKAGYTFDGWYKNGTRFSFTTKITSNITLEAHWTANSSQGTGGNTGTGGTGTTTGITVSQTEHLKVETDPNGLKITVDSNALGGSIWVEGVPLSIERHAHRYEQGDTSVDQKVYIFPFVTQGNSYKVSLGCEFLDDNRNWSVETTPQAVKAGGGSPNSYDLTKFLASKVTGTFDRQNGVHVWLSQTTINSPDDIIKDYNVIQSFWFEFWGELGRRGDSNGQCDGVSSDDSNFASKLKGLTNKCRVGDFPSDEDIAEKGYTYTFSARIKFKLYNLDDEFVTDNIWCDNVYTFSSDVISIPSETDHLKAESDSNGLKITVKNPTSAPLYRHNPTEHKYQGFDIFVFDTQTQEEVNVHIGSDSRMLEYVFPFVNPGRRYKVRIETAIKDVTHDDREKGITEYVSAIAGSSGLGTDFVNFEPFFDSTVVVSFGDLDGFTITPSIPIQSESDIFSDPSKVENWRINYAAILGPEGHGEDYDWPPVAWWDGRDLWKTDKPNNMSLHNYLNQTIDGLYHFPTQSDWSDYQRMYVGRLEFAFKMNLVDDDQDDHYVYFRPRDNIYSQVYNYTGTGLADCGPNLYVSSTGSDTTGTGSSSAPFASLGKALVRMYANNHDSYEYTIHVSGTLTGTAAEIRNMPAQKLTIKKAAGASSAILDGTGKHDTVLKIHTNIPVFLDGLTIQNADATHNGGGIVNSSNVTINNCIIQNNTAGSDGGGINNYDRGVLTIKDSTIKNNTTSICGGGIQNGGGTITVINCNIENNTATGNGGGLHTSGNTTIKNSYITGNRGDWGGAIAAWDDIIIEDTEVTDNRATGGAGVFNNGTMTVKNVTIQDNISNWVSGFQCAPGSTTRFNGSIVITGNKATYGVTDGSYDPCNLFLCWDENHGSAHVTVTGSLSGSNIGISSDLPVDFPLLVAKNYTQYNSGVNPNDYFHIDDGSTNSVELNSSGNVVISTNPWE